MLLFHFLCELRLDYRDGGSSNLVRSASLGPPSQLGVAARSPRVPPTGPRLTDRTKNRHQPQTGTSRLHCGFAAARHNHLGPGTPGILPSLPSSLHISSFSFFFFYLLYFIFLSTALSILHISFLSLVQPCTNLFSSLFPRGVSSFCSQLVSFLPIFSALHYSST